MQKALKTLGRSPLSTVGIGLLLLLTPGLIVAQQSGAGVSITAADGTAIAVTAENSARVAGSTILYTPDWAYTTGANSFGTEVTLLQTNDAQRYTVSTINSTLINPAVSGNSAIPPKGLVLSGAPGAPAQLLFSHFRVGDAVLVNQPVVRSASFTATAVNAARGTNQLVIYTPAYGAFTGTNSYGYELTVRNGIVTIAGGNNSPIPSDGFVLSGHGTAIPWLTSNAIVGSEVMLDGLNVTITTNAASYVYQASAAIQSTQANIKSSFDAYVNAPFAKASTLLSEAKTELLHATSLETSNPPQSVSLAKQSMASANSALNYTLPSRVAEARGTWYRPVEVNLQQVEQTLDEMKAAGLNELYLETWFGGYTIYPSAVAAANHIANQNPVFAGFDPLGAFVSEGKKRGIAVHAWVDGFMVGIASTGGPVLLAHPEWAAKTRNNVGVSKPTPDPATGYYWMDIANPEARQFLLDLINEMVSQYGLAGVNLDYTRFPVSSNWQQDFDFSDYARSAYQAVSGVDPYTLNAITQPAMWNAFTAWLATNENDFMAKNYGEMKNISRQVVVSATPEPGPETNEISAVSQYFDVVIPQGYSLGSIPPLVQQTAAQLTPGSLIYAGIYPFYHHESPALTVAEVLSGHDMVNGTVIFAFGEASEPAVTALKQGVWRDHAISSGMHPVSATRAQLASITDDIVSIYVPRHAMKLKTALELLARMAYIDAAILHPKTADLNDAATGLATLSTYIEGQPQDQVKPIVSSRLKDQFDYLHQLITYSSEKGVR